MRKLARLEKITSLSPIEGADKIELATVVGWPVVVKKGEFQEGQFVVYFEIDSWIPTPIAPFLTKEGSTPKTYKGVQGERLRTVKLRKQISQGLVLPVGNFVGITALEGLDLTEKLGILKWESAEEQTTNNGNVGRIAGKFPEFIKKTDQERVQNIRNLDSIIANETFEVTVKLDGSSMTVYSVKPDSIYYKEPKTNVLIGFIKKLFGKTEKEPQNGVCSRNIELRDDGNLFYSVAKQNDLFAKLNKYPKSIALQGELIAPSIQGNYEKVDNAQFHVYSVWDIDKQEYLKPMIARTVCAVLKVNYVPVLFESLTVEDFKHIRSLTDGKSLNERVKREGVVFKSNNSDVSFKSISDEYLLKKESK